MTCKKNDRQKKERADEFDEVFLCLRRHPSIYINNTFAKALLEKVPQKLGHNFLLKCLAQPFLKVGNMYKRHVISISH